MRVLVFAAPFINDIKKIGITTGDYVIACDNALFHLDKLKIKVNMAVGDFDSLENKGLLKKYEHITLPKEKDETDSYASIKYAYTLSDDVWLIGSIGGMRLEHGIANINLLKRFEKLKIITDNSLIYSVEQGRHEVTYKHYVSLFPFPYANVTLEGFKYPLNDYEMKTFDSIGVSNELIKDIGIINVNKGCVLVILTKE